MSSGAFGADRSGLGVLDVSGNGAPTLRGSLKTPGQAKSVSIAAGTALVTDTLTGLDFVNVTKPATPTLAGSGFVDGFSTDAVVQGLWAYASDRPTGFHIFDLSKKGSFDPISALQTAVPTNNLRAQLEVLPEASAAAGSCYWQPEGRCSSSTCPTRRHHMRSRHFARPAPRYVWL
jgi:hypothetical protein